MRNAITIFMRNSRDITDLAQVTGYFVTTLGQFGVDEICYRHVAWMFRRTSASAGLRLAKLKPAWLARYDSQNYSSDDPLVAEAQKLGVPFRIREFFKRPESTARRREFRNDIEAAGFGDGAVIPVFTRPGDFAYFGLAANGRTLAVSDADLLSLQSLCEAYHAQYNSLASPTAKISLSPRETQILESITRGMSNQAIARALGISANTVDTLVRRSFSKLGATTRIEAALTALSLGLILP